MVYFDNAATTKVRDEVIEAMLPYMGIEYGNASSIYSFSGNARKAMESARGTIAELLNVLPSEVFFTSGGTESDNWAIIGTMLKNQKKGKHLITSKIEHHAVLKCCEYLEKQGYRVTYLPVDKYGLVSPSDLESAICPDTVMATIMYANNEIGTIQPIKELAQVCHKQGVLMHTDAVQTAGALRLDIPELGVDMLSLSGHKFHGPKGIGMLYIKKGTRIDSYLHGGAQENNRRATTENVPAIVGMAKALTLAYENFDEKIERITKMRDKLIEETLKIPRTILNGHPTQRLPGNVNISISFVEGESLILLLDFNGFMTSSGSACTSGSLDPSHVLLAIGLPHETAHGSLRISLGEFNNPQEVDKFIETLPKVVERLRALSPLNEL